MRFKSILFSIVLIAAALSMSSYAQSWKPAPMSSPIVDKLIGTWTSDPHEFMGSTRTDVATHSLRHNGQYLVIDVSSSSSDGVTYTGTIFITVDKDGNIKGWGFGDFGGVTTYTGKTDNDTKISISGTGDNGSTEQREIVISGDKMVHNVTFTMKTQDNKGTAAKMTITYNRNK